MVGLILKSHRADRFLSHFPGLSNFSHLHMRREKLAEAKGRSGDAPSGVIARWANLQRFLATPAKAKEEGAGAPRRKENTTQRQ